MDYLECRELYHHGIKGQSWGERHGPPYPLTNSQKTKEEKKQEKQELKKDRQALYEAKKQATITGNTMAIATNKASKATLKYEKAASKDPERSKKSTQRKYDDVRKKMILMAAASKTYQEDLENAKSLVSKYKEKYGDTKIDDLHYKSTKVLTPDGNSTIQILNENVHNGADWAKSFLATAGTTAVLGLAGVSSAAVFVPATKNELGSRTYDMNRIALDTITKNYTSKDLDNMLASTYYNMSQSNKKLHE